MADELPDIVPMPDDAGMPRTGLGRDAQWSHQFAPSDTSLAQRARGNADKKAYAAAIQDRRRQIEMEEIKYNKDAQDLYFRNQKLNMDKEAATAALGERAQRFKFQAELHPEIIKSRQAQTAASLAMARNRIGAQNLKDVIAQQEQDDTAGFQAEIQNAFTRGVRVGTPEYAETVAKARAKFRAVPTSFFDDIWATTRSTKSPDELVSVTETTETTVEPGFDPITKTRRTETGKVPAGELQKKKPMTGREFLDSLKK